MRIMEEASLRDLWRQKRVQRLIDRLQRKQKDHVKPFSDKILGVNLTKNMNTTTNCLSSSQPCILKTAAVSQKTRKLPRCISEPKIVPRETKLSMQRKSMLDPQYRFKKLFESNQSFSGINFQSNLQVIPERRKSKPKKFMCPKVIVHSCSSLTDQPIQIKEQGFTLSAFSPLVKGLDSWLKKRGKCITNFKRLQKMANSEPPSILVEKSIEPKNTEPKLSPSPGSHISDIQEDHVAPELKQENSTDIKCMLQGGLDDLCSVIRMGYPTKECETWLTTMCYNYPDLTKYPLYWECKASINSRRGIRQESTAIENPKLNMQVSDLISKIKVLNLNTPQKEASQEAPNKNSRILADINVNNLVNSSSIQFSVKKNQKKNENNFLVTPVRRSARKNNCKVHGKNAGIKCVSSLMELSPEIRDKMDFEPNLALINN
ncbi:uncharacterized protein isoform X4 [Rhodnius prolixus]|uniref:uncharacterized protein isoform X4 n=1 Tax=Rhodnius prolixus TaxID=13249 RepID=UPI003D18CB8E